MKVDVQIESESCVSPRDIQRVVLHTLTSESADLDISVAVVDDPTIQRLNRQFLNHDYATDVLSFDLRDEEGGVDAELIVSSDTASREAAERDGDASAELLLYCVHGTLHLLGWDDHNDDDRVRMAARQNSLMSELGYEVAS